MTLFVISTFLKIDSGFLRMRDELADLRVRQPLVWLVSSPDAALLEASLADAWRRDRVAQDRCYAEGWNNALSLLQSTERRQGAWVCFLGAGDHLVSLPKLGELNPESVYCGRTRRIGGHGSAMHRSSVRPGQFWLRIGAWTPSCLFPATMFHDFSLPVDCRIGADIALFFHARQLGYRFINTQEISVDMDEGGLSTDPLRGLTDYRRIAKTAGVGFPALQVGHLLRWLRGRYSSN